MPSSVVCTWSSKSDRRAPRPARRAIRARDCASAIPHGAFTRPPNGAWITTRTEFISSRNCSTMSDALVGHAAGRGALLRARTRRATASSPRSAVVARRELVDDLLVGSHGVELAAQLADRAARGATSAPRTRRARRAFAPARRARASRSRDRARSRSRATSTSRAGTRRRRASRARTPRRAHRAACGRED